ncbi:ead/Ea22-like family protein, partial [Escherichia coli]|uniref:ead/Ea22-like family protein n=1 Tax=Escherichia coli TaxID=562 RepID=UPI00207D60C8
TDRNGEFIALANPANILALVEALEKAQRTNAAQDDHINQQQDRIDILERRNAELGGELSRYSMSPGQADQRMCES